MPLQIATPFPPTPVMGWDISGSAYSGKSLDTGNEDAGPFGMRLKPDGTKVYVSGLGGDAVYQYTLLTPWDLSTGSYDSISADVSGESGAVRGIFFKPDGTKMYITDSTNKFVYQYTLGTPWNVGTASYDTISKDVSPEVAGGQPHDVAFSPDGTKMFIVRFPGGIIYQYTVGTPWNVGTAVYASISKDVTPEGPSSYGVAFRPDGTKMFVVEFNFDNVNQYTLSTPWNVGTATYDLVSADISGQSNTGAAVDFNDVGTIMYVLDFPTQEVYQYTL